MTCVQFQADLPGYHFAILDLEVRATLEAHLATCPDCIAAFIAIKRSLELGDDDLRPSDAARARLRAAVEAEVAGPVRRWAWWERPLALTLAAAATVLAFATVSQLHLRPAAPPHALQR